MGERVEKQGFPLPAIGSCFTFAWINGTFFTTALADVSLSSATAGQYWDLSLLGVACGLAVPVLLERRLGEVSLRRDAVCAFTALVCLGTVFMVLGAASDALVLRILGYAGAFATGFFTGPFNITWTRVYATMPADQAEVAIPLAVALGQLLAIVIEGFQGAAALAVLVAMPILSLACLMASFRLVGCRWIDGPLRGAGVAPAAKRHPLLGWRSCLFVGAVWFALTSITGMTKADAETGFVDTYLAPFLVSFLLLLVVTLLYVFHARRLSMFEVRRAAFPVIVLGLVVLVMSADGNARSAFLIVHAASMFFWALLWISIVSVVRDEGLSATRAMGVVRGWVQFGAFFSVPFVAWASWMGAGLDGIACACLVVLALAFSVGLESAGGEAGHGVAAAGEGVHGDAADGASGAVAVLPAPTVSMAPLPADDPGAEAAPGADAAPAAGDEPFPSSVDFDARCAELAERYGLSPREGEVMACLLRGRDVPHIRDELYISRNTINTHIRHIYEKAGIHSKQELIDLFEGR